MVQAETVPVRNGGTPTGQPAGIGGWLILPLIGLVVTPLVFFSDLAGHLMVLTSLSGLTSLEVGVIATGFAVEVVRACVAPVALLVLMVQKRDLFPLLFIAWLWAVPVLLLVSTAATILMYLDVMTLAEIFDRETKQTAIRGIVTAIIWTLYMTRSRRVANTFVN